MERTNEHVVGLFRQTEDSISTLFVISSMQTENISGSGMGKHNLGTSRHKMVLNDHKISLKGQTDSSAEESMIATLFISPSI
jgi:hypothetical protein